MGGTGGSKMATTAEQIKKKDQINSFFSMGIIDAAATNYAVCHPQSEPSLPLHHPECNGRAPVKPTSLDDQRIDPAR